MARADHADRGDHVGDDQDDDDEAGHGCSSAAAGIGDWGLGIWQGESVAPRARLPPRRTCFSSNSESPIPNPSFSATRKPALRARGLPASRSEEHKSELWSPMRISYAVLRFQ